MINKKFNYHGHTYLCGHAVGNPIDYVNEAIKQELTHLGITEHAPMPNLNHPNVRLSMSDYNLYFSLLEDAKKLADAHHIKFYKGFEIEYFKEIDVYQTYLKDVDYLILGQHFIVKDGQLKSTYTFDSIEDIRIYVDTIIEAIETGYFNLICHPDLCFYNIKNPTPKMYEALRPLIKRAKELDIPLELNANGIRRALYEEYNQDKDNYRYPRKKFFQMVFEEGAKVIVSSDCHNTNSLYDWAMDEAYLFAESLNLNLVDYLKFK